MAAECLNSAVRMSVRLTTSRSTRRPTYCRWSGSEALPVRDGSRMASAMAVAGMGEWERSWLKKLSNLTGSAGDAMVGVGGGGSR